MKKYVILVLVLLAAGILAEPALAQRAGSRGRRPGKGSPRGDCLKKLDLTGEQQAAINGIREGAKQAAQDAETPEGKHRVWKRAEEAIKGQLTDEQAEKLEKCRKKTDRRPGKGSPRGDCFKKLKLTEKQQAAIDAIRKRARQAADTPREKRRVWRRAQEAIEAELTNEQAEELEKCKKRGRRQGRGPHHRGRDCFEKLDLTEEQQAAIDAIRKRAKQAAQDAETPEGKRRGRVWKGVHEAIKAELTKEQLEELEKCRKKDRRQGKGPHHQDCFKKLNLTEEQQAVIDAIRKKARQAAQDAETREEKQQIRRRADEAIKAGLTEEQLKELEKCRERPRPKLMKRQRQKAKP